MEEQVTKSMTTEKNVNLGLRVAICTEKKLLFNFLHCKNHFSVYIELFTVHMVLITNFKAECNSWGQCGHLVKKLGQYLEVYFQNVVFTVYARFFLLNLGYIEPKFERFLDETNIFLPTCISTLIF
jgi:hypothetical protein